jgi:hypothetical protein
MWREVVRKVDDLLYRIGSQDRANKVHMEFLYLCVRVCATDWNTDTEITIYISGLGSHHLNSETCKSTKIDVEAAANKLCFM